MCPALTSQRTSPLPPAATRLPQKRARAASREGAQTRGWGEGAEEAFSRMATVAEGFGLGDSQCHVLQRPSWLAASLGDETFPLGGGHLRATPSCPLITGPTQGASFMNTFLQERGAWEESPPRSPFRTTIRSMHSCGRAGQDFHSVSLQPKGVHEGCGLLLGSFPASVAPSANRFS